MSKDFKILGDGQIWDLRDIDHDTPQKTFEDLFSGRALGQMARDANWQSLKGGRVFPGFKDKGRITGLSITRALSSRSKQAKDAAISILWEFAKNGASGIGALAQARGIKKGWSERERDYWRDPDLVIVGGGVSEGLTGRFIVNAIKRYLSQDGLGRIKVYQAKFPGKEAGFLGALINILKLICAEAQKKGLKKVAAIGLDLGREEIGMGIVAIDLKLGRIILGREKHPWLFKHAVKTPCRRRLNIFLDARKDYTKRERILGERVRALIIKKMAGLIIWARAKAEAFGLEPAHNIGVAVPGCVSADGYIIGSTDYLPFFRKQDGFNYTGSLKQALIQRGREDYRIHAINDGIAAGIANVYFGLPGIKRAKFAFLGVGSGLGGCAGEVSVK